MNLDSLWKYFLALAPEEGGGSGGEGDGGEGGDAKVVGGAGEGEGGGEGDGGKSGEGEGKGDASVLGGGDKGGEAGDEGGEGKPKSGTEGAPESYEEFKIPEGVTIDAELLKGAQEMFKEQNLSQDAAQKMIDMHTGILAKSIEQFNALKAEQQTALRNDPEFGGANFPANQARVNGLINRILSREDAHELAADLESFGVSNNPILFRLFHKIATSVGEDTFAGKAAPGAGGEKSEEAMLADRYPSMSNPDGSAKTGTEG